MPRANKTPDIFYRNAAQVLPLAVAFRASTQDGQGMQIHPKPNAPGSQSALVIGAPGQMITTDREHRIEVQFAWQRWSAAKAAWRSPPYGDIDRPVVVGAVCNGRGHNNRQSNKLADGVTFVSSRPGFSSYWS